MVYSSLASDLTPQTTRPRFFSPPRYNFATYHPLPRSLPQFCLRPGGHQPLEAPTHRCVCRASMPPNMCPTLGQGDSTEPTSLGTDKRLQAPTPSWSCTPGSLLSLLPLPQHPELCGKDSPVQSAQHPALCAAFLQDLLPSGGFNFPAQPQRPEQRLSMVVTA